MELARDGDERAFEAVVERYRVQLLAHARRIVGDHAAEDALQHALACAWDSLRRGCEVRHARAWLFAIVHNAALHMLGDRPEMASETAQESACVHSAEEEFERSVRARAALSAIAALPSREREALTSSLAGRSTRELAVDFGIGEGAVRQLLFRARTRARAALASFAPPALALRLRAHAGRARRPHVIGSVLRRAHGHAIGHATGALWPFPSRAAIGSVLVLVTAGGAGVGSLALSSAPHRLAAAGPSTGAAAVGSAHARARGSRLTAPAARRASVHAPASAAVPGSSSSARPLGFQTVPSSIAAPAGSGSRASSPGAVRAGAPRGLTPTFATPQPPALPRLPTPQPPTPGLGVVPSAPEAVGSTAAAVVAAAGELADGGSAPQLAERVVTTTRGAIK
ncbi:MAG TPA: sigma-70 family RNA polymerase sigma factor [Solirubrobacteraceae bacterium]|nr:sigma-70 family RNA polymerase sigma factor [Solirubrobacteraceae bacterium]